MSTSILVQQVFHVFEKLEVPALVRSNSNCMHVFFNCRFYNFVNTSIMSKVNNFRPFALQNAPHKVSCSMMPAKVRCRRHNTDFTSRYMRHKISKPHYKSKSEASKRSSTIA